MFIATFARAKGKSLEIRQVFLFGRVPNSRAGVYREVYSWAFGFVVSTTRSQLHSLQSTPRQGFTIPWPDVLCKPSGSLSPERFESSPGRNRREWVHGRHSPPLRPNNCSTNYVRLRNTICSIRRRDIREGTVSQRFSPSYPLHNKGWLRNWA
jgi:hypothetical protein